MKEAKKFTRERWKPVPGFELFYEASTHGRIRSLGCKHRPTGKVLSSKPNKDGYRYATLFNGTNSDGYKRKVSVWVLLTYRGESDGMEACHRDGCSTNDALSNLYWGTRAQNVEDARRHGTWISGERNGQAKLSDAQTQQIRERLVREKGVDLAREFGVSRALISMIWNGERRAM